MSLLRNLYHYLIVQRVGYRKPSAVSEDEIRERQAMEERVERLELAMLHTAFDVMRHGRERKRT